MERFVSDLADDPRVRPVRIDTLSTTLTDVSKARVQQGIRVLADSITQHGLLVPPVVMVKDRQVILLAGARRVAAVAQLGWRSVNAFWIGSAQEMVEWFEADQKAHDVHPSTAPLPMTWTQVGTAYDRLLKLLPRGNFTTAMVENTGLHRGDIQGAAVLVRAMLSDGDERVRRYARNMLAESEAGVRKPHAAVRHLREYQAAPGGPEAKIDAKQQAVIIGNLQGQVAGLVTALDLLLPVHPDLSDEHRRAGGESLARLSRVVTRVGRVLREKENPNG